MTRIILLLAAALSAHAQLYQLTRDQLTALTAQNPFERFPESIKADTDILHITRTWTFTRAEQVIAE